MFGDGVGGFAPPQDFSTDVNVNTVTSGDLNGDGRGDVIAAYAGSSNIVVLLNDGQGGFLPPTVNNFPFNSVNEIYNIKTADFNGDGNLDLAAVGNEHFNIFLGNGQGGLSLNSTLNWQGNNAEIVIGNFNNDNLADLAVTGNESRYEFGFGVILGNSSGSFVFNNKYTTPERPSGIAAGDFNSDNITDIVLSADYPYQNQTPQTYFLHPWFGNGSGSFTAGTKVQFPTINDGVFPGDYNGDGILDLATQVGSVLAVVNGNGNGTFQNPNYWTLPQVISVISTDVNQDSKQDLLILTGGFPNSLVSVLLNTEVGGFTVPKAVLQGGTVLAAADLNNDGFKDFITGEDTRYTPTSEILVALNSESKTLLPDLSFEAPNTLENLKTGDFNGDGNQDIVTAHSNNSRSIAVFFGNGTGTLSSPFSTSFNAGIKNVIVGDFNKDGKDDVFAQDESGFGHSLLSKGNGTFSTALNFSVGVLNGQFKLLKGDFNQDGNLDLVIPNNPFINLWLGDGTGRFTKSETAVPFLEDVVTGDWNGDGIADLAGFSGGFSGGIRKFLGDGKGEFSGDFLQSFQGTKVSLISADFNSDGLDDLAFITSSYGDKLVIIPSSNEPPFSSAPIFYSVDALAIPAGGASSDIIAADYNNDNKIDIGYTKRNRARGIIYNVSGSKPCISIDDVTVTEGDEQNVTAKFTVSLSEASSEDVYVNYSLDNGQTTALGADIQNISGRLKIPAGQTSATISVTVNGDLLDEFDEIFLVRLASPSNASLQKDVGVGTIIDNDDEPTITVSDVTAPDNFSGQPFIFKVTLSAPSEKLISFRYSTSDGTAVSGSDYNAVNAVREIQPGTTSVDLPVYVRGDNTYELDEDFFLNISEPVNVTVADNQGKGIITNDDPFPTLRILTSYFVDPNLRILSKNTNK